MTERCAAAVLAGGSSRRLGRDKRRLRLWGDDGPTLLEHVVARVASVCPQTFVVMNDADAWPQLTVPCVADREPSAGALAALLTALSVTDAEHLLICAADLPLISPGLLQFLAQWPHDDVICAADTRRPGLPQPLLARYPRTVLPDLTAAFAAGERRLQSAVAALPHRLVPEAAWLADDAQRLSLLNLNTPADLAYIQQLLQRIPRG